MGIDPPRLEPSRVAASARFGCRNEHFFIPGARHLGCRGPSSRCARRQISRGRNLSVPCGRYRRGLPAIWNRRRRVSQSGGAGNICARADGLSLAPPDRLHTRLITPRLDKTLNISRRMLRCRPLPVDILDASRSCSGKLRNLRNLGVLPLQNFLNIARAFCRRDCGGFEPVAIKHRWIPHWLAVLDRNVAPLHAELLHEIIPCTLVLRLVGLRRRYRCNICSSSAIISIALGESGPARMLIHGLHTRGLRGIEPRYIQFKSEPARLVRRHFRPEQNRATRFIDGSGGGSGSGSGSGLPILIQPPAYSPELGYRLINACAARFQQYPLRCHASDVGRNILDVGAAAHRHVVCDPCPDRRSDTGSTRRNFADDCDVR